MSKRAAALSWLLEGVGLLLIVAGVGLWSVPVALIVAGVGLVLTAFVVATADRVPQDRTRGTRGARLQGHA